MSLVGLHLYFLFKGSEEWILEIEAVGEDWKESGRGNCSWDVLYQRRKKKMWFYFIDFCKISFLLSCLGLNSPLHYLMCLPSESVFWDFIHRLTTAESLLLNVPNESALLPTFSAWNLFYLNPSHHLLASNVWNSYNSHYISKNVGLIWNPMSLLHVPSGPSWSHDSAFSKYLLLYAS